jgi:hypothetical protein
VCSHLTIAVSTGLKRLPASKTEAPEKVTPDLVPFVDPSFIAELEKSGFIKKLYEPK